MLPSDADALHMHRTDVFDFALFSKKVSALYNVCGFCVESSVEIADRSGGTKMKVVRPK